MVGLCVDNVMVGLCVDNVMAGLCVDNVMAGLCVDNVMAGLCVDNVQIATKLFGDTLPTSLEEGKDLEKLAQNCGWPNRISVRGMFTKA